MCSCELLPPWEQAWTFARVVGSVVPTWPGSGWIRRTMIARRLHLRRPPPHDPEHMSPAPHSDPAQGKATIAPFSNLAEVSGGGVCYNPVLPSQHPSSLRCGGIASLSFWLRFALPAAPAGIPVRISLRCWQHRSLTVAESRSVEGSTCRRRGGAREATP